MGDERTGEREEREGEELHHPIGKLDVTNRFHLL